MRVSMMLVGAMLAVMVSAQPARADCEVQSSGIVFPAYDVYATQPLDAVGTLQFKCSPEQKNATPTVRLTLGAAPDGTFVRRMKNDGDTLRYNLFVDPYHTAVWGDGTEGTMAYIAACCPVGKFSDVKVYARIPAGQDVSAGTYVDSMLVTIEF